MSHNLSNKISLAINTQLPEFVREDYPLFIRFIESYYEFLENKLNNDPSSKNDLYARAQQLKSIADVDDSLSDFEENFFNVFLELFPRDTQASKQLLIKNSIPFYKSKGNERAFKYFFRSLFDEEIDLFVPKNDVLIVSGSVWKVLRTVRVTRKIYSVHEVKNAGTKTFNLALPILKYPQDPVDGEFYIAGTDTFQWSESLKKWSYISENLNEIIKVYVNDVLKTHITDYTLLREENKLIFNSALSLNDVVKVEYLNFDATLLVNRQITGQDTKSTAILENSIAYIKSGVPIFEYEIDAKTIKGQFKSGETLTADIIVNDEPVSLILEPFSSITSINVIDGGSSYNVGDPVLLYGGDFDVGANASISSVFAGNYNRLDLIYGGAGFKVGFPLSVTNVSPYSMTSAITLVNATGQTSASSYVYNTDLIYDIGGLQIDNKNYKSNNVFIPNQTIASPNVDTKLSDVFSYGTISELGDITEVVLVSSDVPLENIPIIDAVSANAATNSYNNIAKSFFILRGAGSLGRIDIQNPGAGYRVGDKIRIENIPGLGFGYGARAAVTSVDTIGRILKVEFQPYPPPNVSVTVTGSANLIPGSTTLTGIGTQFQNELNVADKIDLRTEWALSRASYAPFENLYTIGSTDTSPRGLFFKDDGSRLYFLGDTNDRIYQIDLLSPWDLGTANNSSLVSRAVTAGATAISGLYFRPDGTRLYHGQNVTGNNRIIEYSMTQAWNILTATATTGANANVTIRESNVRGITMANNGFSMYIVGAGTNVVNQYYLPTAYRVNTATWVRSFDPPQITAIRDIVFNPSGNSYYILSGNTTGSVLQYSLTDRWNIGTSSFAQSKDLLNQNLLNETSAAGMAFSTDGEYLMILTNNTRYIFRYDTTYSTQKVIQTIDSATSLTIDTPVSTLDLIFPEGTNNTFITTSRSSYDASIEIGNNYVIGVGTSFNTDFRKGDKIMIFNQEAVVNTVQSSRSMNVDSIWTQSKQNTEIGKFNVYPIGGQGYEQDSLPSAIVESSTGFGAILSVTAIMGDGDEITAASTRRRGEIVSIQIENSGSGYKFKPFIDLSNYGDGKAVAEAVVEQSYFEYPGYYENVQGHLSNEKKIQDKTFYNTGTYLIKTQQQFKKFRSALLKLLNPAGTYPFVEFSPPNIVLSPREELIDVSSSEVSTSAIKNLVLNGLVLHLDAANTTSYPGTGTTWFNLVDNFSGTLKNGPVYYKAPENTPQGPVPVEKRNDYFIFDGFDDYVEVEHNSKTSFGSNPFSIDLFFYVYRAATGFAQRILHKGFLADSSMEYLIWIGSAGRLNVSISEDGAVFSRNYGNIETNLEDEKWYHACFTRDGIEGKLYINGDLKWTVRNVPLNIKTSTGKINIMGNYGLTEINPNSPVEDLSMFRGNLAAVKMYNRALSFDEVFSNYVSIAQRVTN